MTMRKAFISNNKEKKISTKIGAVDFDWVPAKIRKRTKESAREEEERDERTPATACIFCGLPPCCRDEIKQKEKMKHILWTNPKPRLLAQLIAKGSSMGVEDRISKCAWRRAGMAKAHAG